MNRHERRAAAATQEHVVRIDWEEWPSPRPGGTKECAGIVFGADGELGEATLVYGIMHVTIRDSSDHFGIGEPLTREAKVRYAQQLVRDVFCNPSVQADPKGKTRWNPLES